MKLTATLFYSLVTLFEEELAGDGSSNASAFKEINICS